MYQGLPRGLLEVHPTITIDDDTGQKRVRNEHRDDLRYVFRTTNPLDRRRGRQV